MSGTRLKKPQYEPMYSVQDPHLQFYHDCRPRDKSKELHGPMRMKLISSYDRIKSELEFRGAVPGQQPHDNWDVVPVIRRFSGNSMKNRDSSPGQLVYVPQRPKIEPMNLPTSFDKEKRERTRVRVSKKKVSKQPV